jgi:hypothetical protein
MAAPVELTGTLGTEFVYRPNEDLEGTTSVQLGLESQLGSALKGVFGYRYNRSDDSVSDWTENLGYLDWDSSLYAYVESTGSLWEGAPPMKMTMGSVDVKYSPFVAWFGYDTKYHDFPEWEYYNVNGVTFDGIKLGTIDVLAFYIFDKDWLEDPYQGNTGGVNFKGNFDDIVLDATFVKAGEPVAYDIAASVAPVQELDLSGRFISDGVEDAGWYKFAVDYKGLPNWRLNASYRDFTAPILETYPYSDTTPPVVDGKFVIPNPLDLNRGLEGMTLEAATQYAGYDFSGQYDYALRTTQFTAAKDDWSAKLKLSQNQDQDEVQSLVVLRGRTVSDVALLKGVQLEGVAEFGKRAAYGGSATYVAPIGLNVAAEYYSDDLEDDNAFGWHQEQGLAVSCSYQIDF